MKKKKVLFLLHLPPPVHGSSMVGSWLYESELIKKTFNASYINLLTSKKVSDSGKLSIRKILCIFEVLYILVNKLVVFRPNLCYVALTTTGFAFYRDMLLVFILKIFDVKRIYHLHNKGVIISSKSRFNRWAYRYVFKDAKVILLSEYLYEDIKDYVLKSDVEICPNGVPVLKNVYSKSSESEVEILFLSNLIESKGVYVLLKAMALLKERGVKFKGVFVGGEGDINSVQFKDKVKNLDLLNYVKYVGKKYGDEKNYIYSKSNVFVFPTFYSNECFPLVLLEAMQHELPIISTPEGGIRSIIEDGVNGFIVGQRDFVKLAEKLEQLIKDPVLRMNMGQNGKMKFNQLFTLDAFERNINDILIKS